MEYTRQLSAYLCLCSRSPIPTHSHNPLTTTGRYDKNEALFMVSHICCTRPPSVPPPSPPPAANPTPCFSCLLCVFCIVGTVFIGVGGFQRRKDASGRSTAVPSPPAAVVLFPDLLPPEVLPAPSPEALASGTPPDAVWGCVDAVRVVMIPQDSLARVQTVVSLDLAVAAATMSAEQALAADYAGLDCYTLGGGGGGGDDNGGDGSNGNRTRRGNGSGNGNVAEDNDEDGDDDSDDDVIGKAFATFGAENRPTLLAEAVSGILKCERDAVVRTHLASRGMDLFYVAIAQDPGAVGAGLNGGSSAHGVGSSHGLSANISTSFVSTSTYASGGTVTGDAGVGSVVSQWRSATGVPCVVNERASALAGRKVVGDAVVMLEDGGARHGAAGLEAEEHDGVSALSSVAGMRGCWMLVVYTCVLLCTVFVLYSVGVSIVVLYTPWCFGTAVH